MKNKIYFYKLLQVKSNSCFPIISILLVCIIEYIAVYNMYSASYLALYSNQFESTIFKPNINLNNAIST